MIHKNQTSKMKQDSIIGLGMHIVGDVFFSGELYMEGSVQGCVCALPGQAASMVIGEQARIDGEVRVAQLRVDGTINGQVTSDLAIEFRANARVTADVVYRSIEMQRGAIVEGRLTQSTE